MELELEATTQAFIDTLFDLSFFEADPAQVERNKRKRRPTPHKQPQTGQTSRNKGLLRGRDFVLPELIDHDPDSGDLRVAGALQDDVALAQIFRLAEVGEQPCPQFSELPRAEQQLERRRYLDWLKHEPKDELARTARRAELAVWEHGGPEAEENFHAWFARKQQRRRTGIFRKANRLANCGVSGRRLDCRDHPEEHQFYGEFECDCRYCRHCGANIFSRLFGKYEGLWPAVASMIPQPGFRSSVVIAKLDFTARNIGRMATNQEVREFNRDIRTCVSEVARELGFAAEDYGFLWCDEFGGWDKKTQSYNTNLHAHGVYVGPYLPQQSIAAKWKLIRANKDGAEVVWIQRQQIDNPPRDYWECEHRRFVRALGHALKYTGKHVLRSDGTRLAELEIAFHGVRRVHTMGRFYRADLKCKGQCAQCGAACDLSGGHEGAHRCSQHSGANLCPLCNAELMFPRQSGYALIKELRVEGRQSLGEARRQVARDQVFRGPRGPNELVAQECRP